MDQTSDVVALRDAAIEDAEEILAIYAPYVTDTPITFETDVPDLEAFSTRMGGIIGTYPFLVAERGGAIVGYAYAHRIGERAAYAWNAELSVYLDSSCRGKGLGRILCTSILDLLSEQGVRNVFSLITMPNEASVGLHEALGFTLMGTQRNAGFKCGAWHDVAWFQKQIGTFSGKPAPLRPYADLGEASAAEIISRAVLSAASRAEVG